MATFTVAKTIGTTGTFSTPQLWEDGAPASMTTAERSDATTFLVAAFVQGEALTFVGSGATGKLIDTDSTGAGTGSYVSYGLISGNVATNDVCTGGTSGATCVITSGTPNFTGCIWEGDCQNQEFSGTGVQLTVSGSAVSSTTYKKFTTVAGASFADNANAQTNALAYNASNGCGIKGTSNNTNTITQGEAFSLVTKMQCSATGSGGRGLDLQNAGTSADKCIVEGKYTATSVSLGCLIYTASSVGAVSNTLIIQRATGADHIVGTGTGSPRFFNCTFAAPDDLATAPTSCFLSGASGTVTLQNCCYFLGDSTKAISAGSATYNHTTCESDSSTVTRKSVV